MKAKNGIGDIDFNPPLRPSSKAKGKTGKRRAESEVGAGFEGGLLTNKLPALHSIFHSIFPGEFGISAPLTPHSASGPIQVNYVRCKVKGSRKKNQEEFWPSAEEETRRGVSGEWK